MSGQKAWEVIIVGAGSAGLPAAIFAAQRGARVLQVEADGRIGGTLFWSSGQISAAGTRLQKQHGIEDSWEEHYADAQRIARNTIDPVLGKLATKNAAETFDWLMDLGLKPDAETPAAGSGHEFYRTRRYYWGGNKAVSILETIRPVHEKLVAEGKIDLRLGTRMTKLLQDASGRVSGIEAEKGGSRESFHGASVVLTTGGYAANPALWAELTPNAALRSICSPFSRGDGIVAARALGARVDGGDKFLCSVGGVLDDPKNPLSTLAGFLVSPQKRMPWEIWIDAKGKRFVREDHPSVDHRERAVRALKDQQMFIVFDEGVWQNAPSLDSLRGRDWLGKRFGNHPNFSKADTLAGLAQRMGVDAKALEGTVKRYNAAVDAGKDGEFGREILPRRIEKGPFYALHTGGFSVVSPSLKNKNEQLQVTDAAGKPIAGLYAAGEVLGFARLSGDAFVNGMSLMPALTFGRLLGQKILTWEKARAAAE